MKKYQEENESVEPEFMIIPNRRLVSFKLLEAYYKMIENYSYLTRNKENKAREIIVQDAIWNLYLLIKSYRELLKDIEGWANFSNQMQKRMREGHLSFAYEQIVVCVNYLTEGVYKTGLTNIEWEKEEFDPFEDTRQWKR